MDVKYAIKVNDKYYSKTYADGWTNEIVHASLYLTESGAKNQFKRGAVQWNDKTKQYETFPVNVVTVLLKEVAA